MTDPTKQQLVSIFGPMAVSVGEELYPVYGAAIARMAWKEALALDQLLNAKKMAEAKAMVRAGMTGEELATEKEQLAVLTWEMAESNAAGWDMARSLLVAGLKVLLALALAAGGL
jgi:hypothetical protein